MVWTRWGTEGPGSHGRRVPRVIASQSSAGSRLHLLSLVVLCSLVLTVIQPACAAPLPSDTPSILTAITSGPTLSKVRTNLDDYPDKRVPRYARFELAFDITGTTAMNPYFPYDPAPPPGIQPGTGITVDALLLPPGETSWDRARSLPCFYYQPVEETGSGSHVAFSPVGDPDWRCRFTPDVVGTWQVKVRATDAGGTTESAAGSFDCAPSDRKSFIGVSKTDSHFFEFCRRHALHHAADQHRGGQPLQLPCRHPREHQDDG